MQEVRTGGAPPVRFQRVVNELPADFKAMRREVRAEGRQLITAPAGPAYQETNHGEQGRAGRGGRAQR